VENRLSEAGGKFAVDLRFKSMADFNPDEVVAQIEPLRRLLEARSKLADLRNKLAGNDKLEDLLSEVLNNTQQLQTLAKDQGNAADQHAGAPDHDKQGE
jgi:type VI secretion system protein ImpB